MLWNEVAALRGNHASFESPATIEGYTCFKKEGIWYLQKQEFGGGFFKTFDSSIVTLLENVINPPVEEE